MEPLKLVRVNGKLKPRHFNGNPYRIAYESGCDYYMTDHAGHRVKVHRTSPYNYESFYSLHVCCPECYSKIVPVDSAFNDDKTQIFNCIICEGIKGRGESNLCNL